MKRDHLSSASAIPGAPKSPLSSKVVNSSAVDDDEDCEPSLNKDVSTEAKAIAKKRPEYPVEMCMFAFNPVRPIFLYKFTDDNGNVKCYKFNLSCGLYRSPNKDFYTICSRCESLCLKSRESNGVILQRTIRLIDGCRILSDPMVNHLPSCLPFDYDDVIKKYALVTEEVKKKIIRGEDVSDSVYLSSCGSIVSTVTPAPPPVTSSPTKSSSSVDDDDDDDYEPPPMKRDRDPRSAESNKTAKATPLENYPVSIAMKRNNPVNPIFVYRQKDKPDKCYKFILKQQNLINGLFYSVCSACNTSYAKKKKTGEMSSTRMTVLNRKSDGCRMLSDPMADHIPGCQPFDYSDILRKTPLVNDIVRQKIIERKDISTHLPPKGSPFLIVKEDEDSDASVSLKLAETPASLNFSFRRRNTKKRKKTDLDWKSDCGLDDSLVDRKPTGLNAKLRASSKAVSECASLGSRRSSSRKQETYSSTGRRIKRKKFLSDSETDLSDYDPEDFDWTCKTDIKPTVFKTETRSTPAPSSHQPLPNGIQAETGTSPAAIASSINNKKPNGVKADSKKAKSLPPTHSKGNKKRQPAIPQPSFPDEDDNVSLDEFQDLFEECIGEGTRPEPEESTAADGHPDSSSPSHSSNVVVEPSVSPSPDTDAGDETATRPALDDDIMQTDATPLAAPLSDVAIPIPTPCIKYENDVEPVIRIPLTPPLTFIRRFDALVFNEDEVEVTVLDGRLLTVVFERKTVASSESRYFLTHEVKLPEYVDIRSLTSSWNEGVITIRATSKALDG